jgi:hypothetical protein
MSTPRALTIPRALLYVVVALLVAVLTITLLQEMADFSPVAFAALTGAILSTVFEYFPGLASDFDGLPDDAKQLVMIGLLTFVIFGAYVLSCTLIIVAFPCTTGGFVQALYTLFLAYGINQGTHRGLPSFGR